jgi:hypothetical protein
MAAVMGLHRKSLVRLMAASGSQRKERNKERGRTYGPAVRLVIQEVWKCLDYVCAERLTPVLAATARHLAVWGELVLDPEVAIQLEAVSVSTVARLLRSTPRRDRPMLPRRGPDRANQLRKTIAAGRLPWSITEPGHFEVDLVHHAGGSAEGDYAHTLQLVDIATGWSERVALLGRSQRAVAEAFEVVLARVPFPVLQLHPDNGPEFLNNHLVRLLGTLVPDLKLSRSRPFHKNDNRFVEQKNDTLVRAYFGHERFDSLEQLAAMNRIYQQHWVFYNLFQPVLRLASKEWQDGKLRRKWGPAATPYTRLLTTDILAESARQRLADLYAATNPKQLRTDIYHQLSQLQESPRRFTQDRWSDIAAQTA